MDKTTIILISSILGGVTLLVAIPAIFPGTTRLLAKAANPLSSDGAVIRKVLNTPSQPPVSFANYKGDSFDEYKDPNRVYRDTFGGKSLKKRKNKKTISKRKK